MQALLPTTRSRRKRSLSGEKRLKAATEAQEEEEEEEEEGEGAEEEEVKADDDPDGYATEKVSTTREASPMRLYWTAPVSRSSSNSASNTRQPTLSTEQDSL